MSTRFRRIAAGVLLALGLLLLWWAQGTPEATRALPSAPESAQRPPPPAAPSPVMEPALPERDEPLAETPDEVQEALPEQEIPPGVPTGSALCRLEPPLPEGQGHLLLGDPSHIPYDGRRVAVADGVALLPLVDGEEGGGVLAIEGYAPVAVRWSAGRCTPEPVVLSAGEAWLSGHVRNAEGEPEGRVFVEGCGNQALTDAQGGYAMTVTPGVCTVNAFRRDGMLLGKADAAEVTILPGQEQVVDFVLPELPTAGLGIQIAAEGEGFAIRGVVPGTAAEEFGLQSGDVVIEVDGTPTKGLSIEEFVELAVGPVGTEVDIVVLRGGQPERLTLDRREIRRGPG